MRHVLVVGILFACSLPVTRADDAAPKVSKVNFELLKTQHMIVKAKVNGTGPYRLLFDTGAPVMLINNRLAKLAGIVNKDTPRPPIALFGTTGQFKIKTFEMGELKVDGVEAIVMDHPAVVALSQVFGQIDGIVGFPFFARFAMTIDYQAREMSFVPNGYKPVDLMQALTTSLMSGQKRGNAPRILAPAGVWGVIAEKAGSDDDAGVTLLSVVNGGPAAKAGLKTGDRLLTIDGRWTDTLVDLFEAAAFVKPGKPVPVTVKRGDSVVTLTVTPEQGF
jgi:membrane-associated protease RseP (regulator of RpoE activity)